MSDTLGRGCGRVITVFVPRGFSVREVRTVCGSTGIRGLPDLCDECAKEFDERAFRENCAANGEQIEED